MKKLLKLLLSCFCLFAVGSCAYICLYEIYNSYFAEEPKNIFTYHNATSPNADMSQTVDKVYPDDDSEENPNIPGADNINTEGFKKLYEYSEKYMVLITSSNYKSANGTILARDEHYIYIASCYSELKSTDRFTVTFSDGTDCMAEKLRHDSVRNILLIRVDINNIKDSTLNILGDISSGNVQNILTFADKTVKGNNPLLFSETAFAARELLKHTTIPDSGISTGTSVFAIGANHNNNINMVSGVVKDDIKVVSYGKTDIEFYEVTFPDLFDLYGSLVINNNGTVIGIYSDSDTVTPIKDIYALLNN